MILFTAFGCCLSLAGRVWLNFVVHFEGWPYRLGLVVRGCELGLKAAQDFCNASPCCLDEFFSLMVHATE